MANDFEDDDDHTTFLRLEGTAAAAGADEDPVVSRAAFQLHSFGIMNSIRDGHPGFVSDDYLNAISAETTLTAAELCTAGLWQRAEGGYEILERQMVEEAVRMYRRAATTNVCGRDGGHQAD